ATIRSHRGSFSTDETVTFLRLADVAIFGPPVSIFATSWSIRRWPALRSLLSNRNGGDPRHARRSPPKANYLIMPGRNSFSADRRDQAQLRQSSYAVIETQLPDDL